MPIRTSTIRPDIKLPFDLYILINNKYIHYMKDGALIESKQLENFKEKKVRKLYIVDSAESKYQSYLDEELNTINDSSKKLEERSQIVRAQGVASVEAVFENPESETDFKKCEDIAQKSMGFVVNNPEAMKQVSALATYDYNIYQHSLNVSVISLTLGAALGIGEEELKVMSTGCMVHDIGKSKINLSPLKLTEEMTPEELKLYKTHPQVGADLMNSKEYVAKGVLEIILNHDETLDGTGFPKGSKNLTLPIQVIGLANRFDRYVVINKMKPADAWKKIQIDHVGQFDLNMIKKLKQVLESLKMM